jgi:uncharacterized protein (TIGR02099 family)
MKWQAFRLRALWCWHQLLTLGLVGIVIIAVLVAISQQLLPLLDRYRPDAEAALSARIGVPVTLERLQGQVDGTQLRVSLVKLELRDPADRRVVLLQVPEVELRPAIWQSLWHREMRVDVRLRGLRIHIDQQPDGSLQLRELAGLARRDAGTAEQTLRFVLRQPVLALSESRVSLALNRFPPLTLSSVEVVNRNAGDSHRLAGRVRLPGVTSDLGVQIDLDGDPLRWQEGRLRLWAELPVLALDDWLPVLPAAAPDISHLRGGGRYWFDFHRGQLNKVQAEVDWPEVDLQHDGRQHALRNLRGVIAWHRHGADWQLAADRLRGTVDGQPWPVPRLALRSHPGTLTIAAAQANIGAAARLLADAPLPEAQRTLLRDAAPDGELVGLRLDLSPLAEGRWQLRRLDTQVRRLAITSTGVRPGMRNVTGWLRWTPQRAWVGLDTRAARLDLPGLLREPLHLQSLRGQLRFVNEADGWRLDSDHLQVANSDARGTALASLTLPRGNPGAGRLSLLGALVDARASSAWRYLPRSSSEKAVAWMRQGIKAGAVRRADITYEGPVHARPDQDPARLLMHFDLVGGRVEYATGWPEIRDLDARVTLDGRHLAVAATRAHLLDGTAAAPVTAEVADLHDPVIEVAAEIAGNGRDIMQLFRDSPLKVHTPGLADTLTLEGPVQGRLALAVPLRGGPVDVDIAARLSDNQLGLTAANLVATGLTGDIRYSSARGLQSSRLDARLLEAPVQADIRTRQGERPEILVNVAGSAEVPALRRWLASSLLDIASGKADYQARVSIPAGGSVRMQLDSSLAGMRIKLPAPFGKTPQEAVPLRYQVVFGGEEQMARLQYGQRMSAGLVWKGKRVERALFRLDSTAAAWPEKRGIEVEGRVARLDLGEWRPWLALFQKPAQPATVAARGETAWPELTRLSVDTRQLLAEGWLVRNAHVGLARQPGNWLVTLDSDELVGSAQWPDAAGSEIGVTFSRLQWPLPMAPGSRKEAPAGLNPVAGLGNRPLVVRGEGLRFAAWPGLGPVAVNGRLMPIPSGLRVDGIALRSPVLTFNGKLDWQWRGGVATRLQGRAGSPNISGLLGAFGLNPGVVSRQASADFDLAWRGAPDKAALGGLDGRLKVVLEEGRLLNVSTGTSASRIFGWFDLDNLRRRFKGDFSDVVRRGLVFDRITLEGPLQAGVMQPAALAVTGPTLQAKGDGRLDLGQKQLDQQITVTMPMTSAVPLAAVVMAGPVVGGAVAAAQMAFDKQIDRATQLHYRVSGDWANPRVEKQTTKAAAQSQARKTAGVASAPVVTQESAR